jgi:hypothetical protein
MRAQEFNESAADELKRRLPSLRKTDYSTIDNLMQRISTRHHITGKKLHDLFVSKYGETPDHWIKKYKSELEEDSIDESKSKAIARTVKDLTDPPKIMQHRAKRDQEREEQYKNAQRKKTNEGVESTDDVQKIKDFIKWSIKQINLEKPYPKIILSKDTKKAQDGHHTGVHTEDAENRCIWVYIGDRNLVDIFRTIFHELVHEKQSQLNMIQSGDSYPGSPIEAMADMVAGKYIKIYGKQHPEIFQ